MSQLALETYLARLYTEPALREAFLADPARAAHEAGFDDADTNALCAIDRAGLRMAADSYAKKGAQHRQPRKRLHEVVVAWWRGKKAGQEAER